MKSNQKNPYRVDAETSWTKKVTTKELVSSILWKFEIGNIDPGELCEVMMINSISPFLIIDQLKPLLSKGGASPSFIVNVSTMEGIFNWKSKNSSHPHTNMSRASLNMMTQTYADQLAESKSSNEL